MNQAIRKIIAVFMLCCLTISLSGCDQTKEEEQEFQPLLNTEEELTLSVVGGYGNFEALEQVADEFRNYYPEVEVVYTSLPNYYQDIQNRFATGKDIDLFLNEWLSFGSTGEKAYLFENAEDLSEVKLELSHFGEEYLEYGRIEGKLCGIPIYLQNFGFAVNEDLLKEYGQEIPGNYEELLTCCENLRAAGIKTPVLTHDNYYGRTFMECYMERLSKGDSVSEAFEATLERAEEFEQKGYIHPDSYELEDGYSALIMRFLEGDIPFATIMLANYSGIRKREAKSEYYAEEPFTYAYIPAPVSDQKNFAYMNHLGTLYLCVYQGSEHLDYANEFLRFLTTKKEMKVLSEIKNIPTASLETIDSFPYLKQANKHYMTEYGLQCEEAGAEAFSGYKLGG